MRLPTLKASTSAQRELASTTASGGRPTTCSPCDSITRRLSAPRSVLPCEGLKTLHALRSVSYTHLTLPTNREV